MVVGARYQARRRPGEIAHHHIDPSLQAVETGVLAGEAHQVGLTLQPDHAAAGHPAGEAQRRGADSCAGLEHALAILRRHGGGQQDGIDRHPEAVARLADGHGAGQQPVLGYRAA